MAEIGTKSFKLEQAYEESQFAASGGYDPSGKLADGDALEQFAKEE